MTLYDRLSSMGEIEKNQKIAHALGIAYESLVRCRFSLSPGSLPNQVIVTFDSNSPTSILESVIPMGGSMSRILDSNHF